MPISLYLYSYLILMTLTWLFFITGELSLKFCRIRNDFSSNSVTSILLGLGITLISYAIFLTNGKTILILFIPFLIFIKLNSNLFKESRGNRTVKWIPNNIGGPLITLSFWFFFYSLLVAYYFDNNSNFTPLHPDLMVYAKFGNLIRESGNENILGSINIFGSIEGTQKYHYIDIYLPDLITNLFKTPLVSSSLLVSYPALISYGSLLIQNISKHFSINSKIILLTIPLLIWSYGVNSYLPLEESGNYLLSLSASAEVKYLFPFLVLLSGLFLIHSSKYREGILILSMLPIVSYTLLPATLFAITFFLIYKYFSCINQRKENIILASFLLLELIIFFLFYHFFGVPKAYSRMDSISILEIIKTIFNSPLPQLKIIIGTLIKVWVDYIPHIIFMLLLFITAKKKAIQWDSLIIGGLIILGGLIAWAIFSSQTIEAYQLFWIAEGATIQSLFILISINLISKISSIKTKTAISSLIIITFISARVFELTSSRPWVFSTKSNAISYDFIKKIEARFPNTETKKMAYFCEAERPEGYYTGSSLICLINNLHITSVSPSIYNTEKSKDFMLSKDYYITPFYQFANNNQHIQSWKQKQILFLKENNIRYLISNGCSDNTNLLSSFEEIEKDSISNLKLYKIND